MLVDQKTVIVTTTDVLSEAEVNELLYWRDQHTSGAFAIGRIAAERVRFFAERGFLTAERKKISETQILARIGGVCGRARTTVLLYKQNYEFYADKDCSVYSALAFCHFDFARSQPERWKLILDYALSKPQITEAELYAHFPPQSSAGAAEEISELSHDLGALDSDYDAAPRENVSTESRVRASTCASAFLESSARVRAELNSAVELIGRYELKTDLLVAKDQIEAAEIALRRALPTLSKALNREL